MVYQNVENKIRDAVDIHYLLCCVDMQRWTHIYASSVSMHCTARHSPFAAEVSLRFDPCCPVVFWLCVVSFGSFLPDIVFLHRRYIFIDNSVYRYNCHSSVSSFREIAVVIAAACRRACRSAAWTLTTPSGRFPGIRGLKIQHMNRFGCTVDHLLCSPQSSTYFNSHDIHIFFVD